MTSTSSSSASAQTCSQQVVDKETYVQWSIVSPIGTTLSRHSPQIHYSSTTHRCVSTVPSVTARCKQRQQRAGNVSEAKTSAELIGVELLISRWTLHPLLSHVVAVHRKEAASSISR